MSLHFSNELKALGFCSLQESTRGLFLPLSSISWLRPPAGVMTRMGRIITLANESGPVMDASNVALDGVHGVTGGALHLVVPG